jgi:hypothetical protein
MPSPSPAPAPRWYDELSLNALVSAAFVWGVNDPQTGVNALRVFDWPSNGFNVGVASFVVQRTAASPGEVGFRADVDLGGLIPTVAAGNGEAGAADAASSKTNAGLRQGYASWVAPLGNGLRLDLGKFVTLLGYEYAETFDNIDDNYSRSLLFGYAIPFTHTGLQAGYAFSTSTKLTVQIVNGWDALVSKSDGKTVCAQLALTPSDSLSAYLSTCDGSERVSTASSTADHLRAVADLAITYKLGAAFSVGLGADLGLERGTSQVSPGDDAVWGGAALYLRWDHPSGAGVALRGEVMRDAGGTRLVPGQALTVEEITVTPFVKLGGHLTLRGEGRVDFSDRSVFQRHDGTLASAQPTVALNAVYAY